MNICIVIQFSDISEPKNNCSVLTVATFNFIEDSQKKEEDKVEDSEDKQDDQGKLLMLRIVWFSIFFNFIEEHGQKKKEEVHKDKVKEPENKEDDGITQGKFLMLLIVWFSIF